MPKLERIRLEDIDEPALPIRCAMDEDKLRELGESMQELGLLSPIGLRPADGRYEIEYGHRRYLAALALKWPDIPALIFQAAEIQAGAAMLAENVIREDISAAEEAVLFAQCQEKYGLDERGLVERFKRSPDYIADRLHLLRDDLEVFQALLGRKINFSVAKALNRCDDENMRRYFLAQAIRAETGAKVVESWIRDWRASQVVPPAAPVTEPATAARDAEMDAGLACCICGGFRDPFNLVSVYIHKWELEQILKIVNRGPEEVRT
jgi:ParB family transcriptional regulator, chromosome partitioning protein